MASTTRTFTGFQRYHRLGEFSGELLSVMAMKKKVDAGQWLPTLPQDVKTSTVQDVVYRRHGGQRPAPRWRHLRQVPGCPPERASHVASLRRRRRDSLLHVHLQLRQAPFAPSFKTASTGGGSRAQPLTWAGVPDGCRLFSAATNAELRRDDTNFTGWLRASSPGRRRPAPVYPCFGRYLCRPPEFPLRR